jgi:hypothetical protein
VGDQENLQERVHQIHLTLRMDPSYEERVYRYYEILLLHIGYKLEQLQIKSWCTYLLRRRRPFALLRARF